MNLNEQKIKDIWFDFEWDVHKVWKIKAPVEFMDISDLLWHLNVPLWRRGREVYAITPNMVLSDPILHKKHFKNILNSNLKHPIDIMWWNQRWMILDGVHRLAKAKHLGWKTIKVRKIPQSSIKDICK